MKHLPEVDWLAMVVIAFGLAYAFTVAFGLGAVMALMTVWGG